MDNFYQFRTRFIIVAVRPKFNIGIEDGKQLNQQYLILCVRVCVCFEINISGNVVIYYGFMAIGKCVSMPMPSDTRDSTSTA